MTVNFRQIRKLEPFTPTDGVRRIFFVQAGQAVDEQVSRSSLETIYRLINDSVVPHVSEPVPIALIPDNYKVMLLTASQTDKVSVAVADYQKQHRDALLHILMRLSEVSSIQGQDLNDLVAATSAMAGIDKIPSSATELAAYTLDDQPIAHDDQ